MGHALARQPGRNPGQMGTDARNREEPIISKLLNLRKILYDIKTSTRGRMFQVAKTLMPERIVEVRGGGGVVVRKTSLDGRSKQRLHEEILISSDRVIHRMTRHEYNE